VRIDANFDYPTIDLNLIDLADISYIPLKPGKDNIMFGYPSATSNIFVYQDKIIIADKHRDMPKLLIYNRSGDLVKIIGSNGRGPGEYIAINGIDVDTVANEIFIWHRGGKYKFMVYGMDGKFKREKEIKNCNAYIEFALMNNDNILVYNRKSKYIFKEPEHIVSKTIAQYDARFSPEYKTVRVFDSKTFSEVTIPHFDFEKPGTYEINTIHNSLTHIEYC
jgi:hypothetical protein